MVDHVGADEHEQNDHCRKGQRRSLHGGDDRDGDAAEEIGHLGFAERLRAQCEERQDGEQAKTRGNAEIHRRQDGKHRKNEDVEQRGRRHQLLVPVAPVIHAEGKKRHSNEVQREPDRLGRQRVLKGLHEK
jgi:hypothetical protein